MRFAFAIFLTLLVITEVKAHFFGMGLWTKECSSITYVICGIFISILPLIKSKSIKGQTKKGLFFRSIILLLFVFMILGFSWIIYGKASTIFSHHPLNYQVADMLPVMKVMCNRFVRGEMVYKIIPEIWGGMQPIYLPSMWMPFIPSIISGLDMRWTSVVALLLGFCFIFFINSKEKLISIQQFLVFIPLGLLTSNILNIDHRLISITEESIVVFYYLFLAFALFKRNVFLIGLAIALCILSRYALIFWGIMYVCCIYFFENKRRAIYLSVIIVGVVTSLLVVTRAYQHLDVILNMESTFLEAVINKPQEYGPTVYEGLGIAKFFDYSQLPLLHQFFKITAVGIPLCWFIFYFKLKDRINIDFFAICSLKLSLVFFYNLLIIPHLYLFYTSTFFSIAILSAYLKKEWG